MSQKQHKNRGRNTHHGNAERQDAFSPRGPKPEPIPHLGGREDRTRSTSARGAKRRSRRPYDFVPVPRVDAIRTAEPIWHDGASSAGKLSGEIRFELETLTPLLVGWERGLVGNESDWGKVSLSGVEKLAEGKPVLCPLRAPWDKRPVIIPGDSLKGLLRHELGALLGAPMERVAERSYSYRPNARYPAQTQNRFLVPRLARVPEGGVELRKLDESSSVEVRVPARLELFPDDLEYNKKANRFDYVFGRPDGQPYRGGQGAGERIFSSKRNVYTSLTLLRKVDPEEIEHAEVRQDAQDGYLATLRHLIDSTHGHFTVRHPDVRGPADTNAADARNRIIEAAKNEVFQPGDFVWVEWDVEEKRIVSFGWHYCYRWAYVGTVHKKDRKSRRPELFPLQEECEPDADGAPTKLSPVRRLFGYVGDNPGSEGIGKKDYAQLMSRVSANAALEVVGDHENDGDRFLNKGCPIFLKELGMPRPSAVEHYIRQERTPGDRPDRAELITYGDAEGYDTPGDLAGRKFYLDREDAYTHEPWKEDPPDKNNTRSTVALEVSKPGRRFRFTIRFRDLEPEELAAVVVALCPDRFKDVLGGTHPQGYCSKLGYARPLGWGSVRIEAKKLLFLNYDGVPTLSPVLDLVGWVRENYKRTGLEDVWLAIHRRNHPRAGDYPKEADKNGNQNTYTYHTNLRAEHALNRRYKRTTETNESGG